MVSSVSNFEHDEEFWFADGNIVLVANDGQTAFQVYKGLLSRKSKVFSDMFDFPQPIHPQTGPQEILDGRPVVPLSEAAKDIGIFLGLLFDGWK